ncbi:uncharacterized protein LOC107459978 [Arachis duranensis]|uniref:Uncharacterized protein LOC107459978 n=1 Tax=Arachis duranensis TaxID=130453 RepID=A0A6P4B8E3_ARADU|nr:uncharacterized protein LOC107459978 [Arachis duranensis]
MRPCFLQLYIYDTDHELQNRMLENTQLHETLIFKLQKLLHRYNPFLHMFRQLAQRSDVAAIIVGDDVETIIHGRDIKIRPNDHSTVLQAGSLLQQYVVDNYVKIEGAELYQGLQYALHTGETNAENVGRKRTKLPSSFIGSRRDMTQRYEDGMEIVLKKGKPDIFLTMTCNPSWTEITSKLNHVQTPQYRPDLTTRIFRAKFKQLKEDVITKGVLGKVKSYIYVTKFQKRGLPHVHMLLILENNDKLIDPEHYDSLVRAEIPSKEVEPHLHDAVLKHMIHGPCRTLDQSSPCMKKGQCKCNYPKEFAAETRRGDDSYPQYKRQFDTPVPINQNVTVDNRWVVSYNPWLLLKYDCHINVEICSSIKSIK